MASGVLWLTACLVTATCGHFLTKDRLVATTDATKVHNITKNSVVRSNTSNNGENQSQSVNNTVKGSGSSRELDSAAYIDDTSNSDLQEEQTSESSRSRESQTHEQNSAQTENPSTESSGSEENIVDVSSAPNTSDGISENPIVSESQESISAEILSLESLSAESANSQHLASSSSEGADSGANSNGEANVSNSDDNDEIVQTTHGPVTGHKWQETEILAFIDIPYGRIEGPFDAPSTAKSWVEEGQVVTEHNTRCPQIQGGTYVGDLNCLTLSIFKPANATNAGVFFYVHDSSFHSGDPMIYGPEHLVPKGVILVLPNYRIGALGFLCLQNKTAPGNAGLKDLSEGLEWISNNIDRFGGNSSNIVVGGDGDAGALAGYLALSSPSKYYIHKVISEGGSMLSHLAFDRNPIAKAITLAENIRKNQTDGVIYNNTFAESTVQMIVEAAIGMRFNPCIEHDSEPFLDASPWTLLQNKEINTTFMIGSASHAGTHEVVATTDTFIELLNTDIGFILPEDLLFRSSDVRVEHALRVKTQYFGNGTISKDQMEQLSLWSTDASYVGPLIRFARPLVDAGATVYLYEFDFVGSLNRELISLATPVDGAVRSDIIGYLFTQSGHVPEEDTPEKRTIDLLVDLWVSFINTGTPIAKNIEWVKLKPEAESEEEFLHISSNPKTIKGLHVDRLQLWTEMYNEYFIERSSATPLTAGHLVFITIMFCITNTKLDYH